MKLSKKQIMAKKKENKKPVGRPLITLEDLGNDWSERMRNLSKDGASIVELAVMLDISRETFYALSERDKEFSYTVKKCKQLCEVWWLKSGRKNLENKDFSYTGWYMNMKNRFNWRDKQDVTSNDQEIKQITGINIK